MSFLNYYMKFVNGLHISVLRSTLPPVFKFGWRVKTASLVWVLTQRRIKLIREFLLGISYASLDTDIIANSDIINAGKETSTLAPGASTFGQ